VSQSSGKCNLQTGVGNQIYSRVVFKGGMPHSSVVVALGEERSIAAGLKLTNDFPKASLGTNELEGG
jgi:hypothetical protein